MINILGAEHYNDCSSDKCEQNENQNINYTWQAASWNLIFTTYNKRIDQ